MALARLPMTEVAVQAVSSQGAGIGKLPDGRVVFVHRTAPGDTAEVRITRDGARWARAELVRLLEPGDERRTPPCPLYDLCGGCVLQHIPYRDQLRWKGRMVADALERIGDLEGVEPPPVEPSPDEFEYRSRVAFHLRRRAEGHVVAGFHRLERPGSLLDVDDRCLLPEAPIPEVWGGIRAAWGPDACRLPAGEGLRLTLRSVVGGVTLVVEPENGAVDGDPGDPEGLVEDVEGLRAIWMVGEDGEPRLLAGDEEAEEEWWGGRVRPGARAFLQVNREGGRAVHEAVLQEVGDPRDLRVVDAYCGIGSYGRRLAHRGATVVGLEMDPEAVEEARRDAPPGLTVLEGRVEERLAEVLPADLVIVNPPRAGLHQAVPDLLRRTEVPRIVYVSCDPATLARDVGRLGRDYELRAVRAFDLFPQTAHVESLAVLERVGSSDAVQSDSPPSS